MRRFCSSEKRLPERRLREPDAAALSRSTESWVRSTRGSEVASEAITSAEGACRGPEWSGGAGRGWLGSRRPRAPRPRRGEEAASARARAGHTVGTVHTRFVPKKGQGVNISSPRAGDSLRAPWGAFGDARGDTAGSRQHFDTWTPDWGSLAYEREREIFSNTKQL